MLPGWTNDAILLGHRADGFPFWPAAVRLGQVEQNYHATIWGKTGSGKSKLLQGLFLQHLGKRHGVGIIEPHHDLSFETLCSLISDGFFAREEAFTRLVYLDWGNGAYVPFNVLASSAPPHTIASNVLEAMLRVWPELADAPMFQMLLLSGLVVLIANRLPITFLYRVLTDAAFRGLCLQRVSDPLVQEAFASYDRLGRDQTQAAGSTLRRAFLLSFSPLARYTLGQPDNWLDFRRLMDEGRSVIINLGNINDHETRRLLGALLLVQIEQAALSRTDLLPSQRRPWTLLIDEWPAFCAQDKTIATILSQTRKFKLRLYLAAQSLAQLSSARLIGALENCRMTVVFGLGRASAETQSRHIGSADPFAIKEEPLTETQHSQYLAITDQFEAWTQELQNLPARTAYAKIADGPAVKIKTPTIRERQVRPEKLAEVLATYRKRYQRTEEEALRAIAAITLPEHASAVEGPATSVERTPLYTRFFRPAGGGRLPNDSQ